MNPHLEHSGSLFAIFQSFRRNRRLIVDMTKREIKKRYQGSIFGLAWAFINPLLMLAVYTFVFTVIFQRRWGISENESRADFPLLLFTGLIIFSIFSESMTESVECPLSDKSLVNSKPFSKRTNELYGLLIGNLNVTINSPARLRRLT